MRSGVTETEIELEKNPQKKLSLYKSYLELHDTKDFKKNIILSNQAIVLAIKQKKWSSKADFIRLKANAYYLSGKLDSAGYFYYQSLHLLENKAQDNRTAMLYNNLGRFNRKVKKYNKALFFYDKAFCIYKFTNNQEGLATIYNESGKVYEYLENFDEAIIRYKKSLAIQVERGYLVGQGYALEFIGSAFLEQKKFAEAEKYLLNALVIRIKTKDDFAIALNYNALGNLYFQIKDDAKSIEYLNKSNDYALNAHYLDLMNLNYVALTKVYKSDNNFQQAFVNLENNKKIEDSLFNIQKLKQIEELSAKYETEKKDKEILDGKNKLYKKNIILFSLAVLVSILFLLFRIRYHKQKTKHQKALLQQQILSVKAVINAEDNERKRMALHLHDGVGQLLSATNLNLQILEEFKEDETAFNAMVYKTRSILKDAMMEVRTLSHQIMPNMLIKNSLSNALRELMEKVNTPKLSINLLLNGLTDDLEDNVRLVVFRSIQECINNTIKHADATKIDIRINQNNEYIQIFYADNGKGFDVGNHTNFSTDGLGLQNLKSRIEILKGKFIMKSTIGKGSEINITIPQNDSK